MWALLSVVVVAVVVVGTFALFLHYCVSVVVVGDAIGVIVGVVVVVVVVVVALLLLLY